MCPDGGDCIQCKWEIADDRIVFVSGLNTLLKTLSIKLGDMVFFIYEGPDAMAVRIWRIGGFELLFTGAEPNDGGITNTYLDYNKGGGWKLSRKRACQVADENVHQGGLKHPFI